MHKMHMTNILLKLYKDSEISGLMGFKGGTAAYLFYGLSRFSVDLDFDLLEDMKKPKRDKLVKKITSILEKDYQITDRSNKRYTLFWLINYKKGNTNIKIEVSKRKTSSKFKAKRFYGVSIPVMVLEDAMANKLMALVDRYRFANRDVFDAHYFLSLPEAGEINFDLVKAKLGLTPEQLFKKIIKRISKKRPGGMLQGMGELLTESQKRWVKEKLVDELTELIKLQQDLLKS